MPDPFWWQAPPVCSQHSFSSADSCAPGTAQAISGPPNRTTARRHTRMERRLIGLREPCPDSGGKTSTQVRYRHAKKDTVNSGPRWWPEKLQNLIRVKQTSQPAQPGSFGFFYELKLLLIGIALKAMPMQSENCSAPRAAARQPQAQLRSLLWNCQRVNPIW